MGKDLAEASAHARDRFAKANDVLGFDLAAICFDGPEEELRQTRATQPALYVHSCILADLLAERDVKPVAAAGHSLGEYSALYAAGAFSFEDGLRLVQVRASAMQQAGKTHPGTMAAVIGLDESDVQKLCQSVREHGVAVPANFNSPGQVVVSGSVPAIEKIVETAKSAGARMAKPLNVSGAFHSPLMQPAAEELHQALQTTQIAEPRVPVVSNVTARPHGSPEEIRKLLAGQLLSPVRWAESMQYLAANVPSATWLEIGSGSVLAGLLKRAVKGQTATPIGTHQAIESQITATGVAE